MQWRFEADRKSYLHRSSGLLQVDSAAAPIDAGLPGARLVSIFYYVVNTYFESGRLVKFFPELARTEVPVSKVYPKFPPIPARLRALVDHPVEHISQNGTRH